MLKRYVSRLTATRFFKANIRLMAGITLFVWCFMLMYGLLVYKPMYTAESVVMIKDSAIVSAYIEPEQMYSSKTTSSNAANPVLNTMGLLNSAAIMDALWDFFHEKHPEELKKLNIKTRKEWEKFYKDGSSFIKAKNKPGTDLITVSFTWSDPKITREAAEVVLAAFQDASLDLNQAEQRSRSKYLAKQVTDLESELEEVRRRKTAYKQEMKTVNVNSESVELTKLRTRFEEKLNQILARSEGKKAELGRYQTMLGMTPEQALEASAIGMNATLGNLKNEYYTLSQTHAFLTTTLTDKNPKVQEVRNKMIQVEDNIRKELANTLGYESDLQTAIAVADTTRGTVINEMVRTQAEVIFLDQQASALRAKLDEVDAQVAGFPVVEEGISNIEQRERSLSDSLDALRKKYLEAQLREAQTLSNVFIVDEPRLPKQSDFPNPVHLAVISLLLGLGAGLGAVVLRYKLQLDELVPQVVQNIAECLEQRERDMDAIEQSEGGEPGDPLDELFAGKPVLTIEADPETRESTLHSMEETIRAMEAELKNRKAVIEKQQCDMQQREKTLDQLAHEIEEGQRHLVELQNALSARGGKIADREAEIRAQEEKQRRKSEQLRQELARYSKALATRAELLKRKEELLQRKQQAEKQARRARTEKSLNITLARKLKEYNQRQGNAGKAAGKSEELVTLSGSIDSELRNRILARYLGIQKEKEAAPARQQEKSRSAIAATFYSFL